jgi:D-glycero-D-manno-heptose 1,7-bisphosphate phosphatase
LRPAVFVDRDGTLIEDRGYVHRLDDYAPLPGAYEAVRLLRAAGFAVIVVSNQSGVGRGYFSQAELEGFEAHLCADFAARDAALDAIYSCPHAPAAHCACRKPATGMLERARKEHDLDLARSWVIGDKAIDLELARRSGCRAAHVQSGVEPLARTGPDVLSERDLLAAVRRILATDPRTSP